MSYHDKGMLPGNQAPARNRGSVVTQQDRVAQSLPVVYIDRVILESAGNPVLKATVDFCIKQNLIGNSITEWVNSADLRKGLKIKLIQSADPAMTENLSNSLNTNILGNGDIQVIEGITIDDAIGGADNFIENHTTSDEDGNTIVSVYFSRTFELTNINPTHLSYFVLTYIGTDDHKIFNGPASLENVVSDGKVESDRVQDFRNLDKIKKQPIDLTLFEEDLLSSQNTMTALKSYNMQPSKKISHFSEILLSRDKLGRAKFVFAIDQRSLVRSASSIKNIYETIDKDRQVALLDSSSIQLMTLKRRRISLVNTNNKLGNPIKGETVYDKNTTIAEELVVIDGKNKISPDSPSGIAEIEIFMGSRSGIKFFTGYDNSIGNLTEGIYQYGIEVIIDDKTEEYLKKQLEGLLDGRRKLHEYYIDAMKLGVTQYDPYTDTSAEKTTEIENSSGNYNLSSNKFTQNFINTYKDKIDIWQYSVEEYFNTLAIFINTDDISKEDLIKMTNPNNASPKSIMVIIKAMDDLIIKLNSITGIGESAKSRNDQQLESDTYKPYRTNRAMKIEHWFTNDEFDTGIGNNIGYDYISTSLEQSDVSTNSLRKITDTEYVTKVAIQGTTDWAFLLPSFCFLGEESFSFIANNTKEEYSKLEAAILAYNSTNSVDTSKLDDKSFTAAMAKFYADFSLAIKSADGQDIIKPIEPFGVEYPDPEIIPDSLFLSLSKYLSKSGTSNISLAEEYDGEAFLKLMLTKVEVLAGFHNSRTGSRIKSLHWVPISEERMKILTIASEGVLCRITPSKEQLKGLKLPVFNNYFILTAEKQ